MAVLHARPPFFGEVHSGLLPEIRQIVPQQDRSYKVRPVLSNLIEGWG